MTAPGPRSYRVGKQPRVGEWVLARTGAEEVVRVFARGLSLETRDTLGRVWLRTRAPEGHWSILTDVAGSATISPMTNPQEAS